MISQHNLARLVLLIGALIVLYFVFQIFRPFLTAIAVALILCSLSWPVFDWIQVKMGGRRGWAALLTCLGLTCVIVVPCIILLFMLAWQVGEVYQQAEGWLARSGVRTAADLKSIPWLGDLLRWMGRFLDPSRLDLAGYAANLLRQVSIFLISSSTTILSSTVSLFVNFFLMIVTMFFLFKDGHMLLEELASLFPVSKRYAYLLSQSFREVAKATIIGSLLTAAAQGIAAGAVFWGLGISNAVFWGTLSGFFSLIPVVGATIVWVPWALYFLLSGQIAKGVILIVLESLLVGSIDNVLRTLLIEGRVKMHTMVVFFAIMGGIAYFGVLGMVFGPIIVALGMTLLDVYRIELRDSLRPRPGP